MLSLRWTDSFLETLHRCGFGHPALCRCVPGVLQLQLSARGTSTGPIEQVDPDDEPTTGQLSMREAWNTNCPKDHSADEFDEALETLLERIDLLEHHRHPATRARNAEPHHPDACGNP